jgi:hypothetical protein
MDMWIRLQLLVITALAFVLAGCASTPKYKTTVGSPNKGALVSGSMKSWPLVVGVKRIDGRRLGFWQEQPVLVEPGMRVLSVHGEYTGFLFCGYGDTELRAILQAGHSYRVEAERKKRMLTFWIEDAVTHDLVSDRQTTNASLYIPCGCFAGGF